MKDPGPELKDSLEYLKYGIYEGKHLYRHSKTLKFFIYNDGEFIIIDESKINFEEIK